MKRYLWTASKLLLGAVLVAVLAACGDTDGSQVGGLEPTISLEDKSTATKAAPSLSSKPSATATEEATESADTSEIVTAVEITVGAANVRSGPGTDAAIVGAVGPEDFLELIETSEDGQWYKVESESGLVGWVGSSVASIVEAESPQVDQRDGEEVESEETPTATNEDGAGEELDPGGESALVTYVGDGDTIVVELNGVEERVRYIGINAPELEEDCGAEALRANRQLVDGKTVRLVRDVNDRDGFNRLLRHVYVGDMLVSEELVKQGWAFPISYPPDTAMDNVLSEARKGAPKHDCQSVGVAEPTAAPPAAPQEPAPPAPAEPPSAEPAPAEPPAPAGPPAGLPGFCTCSGPDLNCNAFGTHAQAQACHDYCVGLGYGDVYNLDRNHDGAACESLP